MNEPRIVDQLAVKLARELPARPRNRLAFPQARLIDAVFHGRLRPLPNAAGRARPAHTAASDSVTVTGKVVDAACFMLHVAAATAASHKDCGAACLARWWHLGA